jgi:hypothetical protein
MRVVGYLVLICLFFVSAVPAVLGQSVSPFTFPTPRTNGFGGPHVAYTDDINAIFVNPAVFRDIKQIAFGEITLGVHGDVFGLANIIAKPSQGSGDFDTGAIEDFAKKSGGKIPFGVDVRGPIAAGWVGKGFGFGLFDRAYMDGALIGTNFRTSANMDMIINFGMSFDFLEKGRHDLNWGFMTKLFGRGLFSVKGAIIDMSQDFDSLLTDNPMDIIIGGGVDLGLRYIFADNLTVGLVIGDLISPSAIRHYYFKSDESDGSASELTYDDMDFEFFAIRPRVNTGVAYRMKPLSFLALAFMADYRDLINLFENDYSTKNPILNIGLGIEAKFFNIIALRLGMNEMLPALGIGFHFGIIAIDFAYYGKELSNEPGKLSTYAMDLGILFRY